MTESPQKSNPRYDRNAWNIRAKCHPTGKIRSQIMMAMIGAKSISGLIDYMMLYPDKGARLLLRLQTVLEARKPSTPESPSTNTSEDA